MRLTALQQTLVTISRKMRANQDRLKDTRLSPLRRFRTTRAAYRIIQLLSFISDDISVIHMPCDVFGGVPPTE